MSENIPMFRFVSSNINRFKTEYGKNQNTRFMLNSKLIEKVSYVFIQSLFLYNYVEVSLIIWTTRWVFGCNKKSDHRQTRKLTHSIYNK